MMIWKSILIAFSMFSAIPVPQTDWEEKSMRYSLCAFPLVGVVIGLLSFGWGKLCMTLALPDLLRGAGYCLIPALSTGGIHLDGYADTWDALSSHAGIEKKQEILKDPHLGAFAGIRLCMYFAASLALWCALPELNVFCLLGLYGLSRCLSGIALMSFPLRAGSGLARSFAEAAEQTTVRRILIGAALAFAGLLGAAGAGLCTVAAVAVLWKYRRLCEKEFGGLSGDLAGWFVQTAELWMLGMLVVSRYVGGWL